MHILIPDYECTAEGCKQKQHFLNESGVLFHGCQEYEPFGRLDVTQAMRLRDDWIETEVYLGGENVSNRTFAADDVTGECRMYVVNENGIPYIGENGIPKTEIRVGCVRFVFTDRSPKTIAG